MLAVQDQPIQSRAGLLSFLGIGPIPWVETPNWVLPSVIIMDVWNKEHRIRHAYLLSGVAKHPAGLL